MNNNQQAMVCIPNLEQESSTHYISIDHTTNINFPNLNCPFTTNKRESMRRHFRTRHPQDIIIIEEEGLLPQWINCGIIQKKHTQIDILIPMIANTMLKARKKGSKKQFKKQPKM
jgi:hypothetical protein